MEKMIFAKPEPQSLLACIGLRVAAQTCGIMKQVRRPVQWLRRYYSVALQREVSMRQTWLLLNAQAAFAAAFFPTSEPLVLRLCCMGWLLSAMLKCKGAMQ